VRGNEEGISDIEKGGMSQPDEEKEKGREGRRREKEEGRGREKGKEGSEE